MDSTISCPQCQRRTRIADEHVGRKVRCPACQTVFIAERAPDSSAEGGRSRTSAERSSGQPEPARGRPSGSSSVASSAGRSGRDRGVLAEGRDAVTVPLQVAIKNDPDRALKGVFKGLLTPDGLELRQGVKDPIWIPVGADVGVAEKGLFTVQLGDRTVKMAVGRLNLYNQRLARDLVAFLQGRREMLSFADYVIPSYLVTAAFLPVGAGFISMAGGAIGGGLGGAYAGTLITVNLAVVRKEKWPMAARVGTCLGVSALGYLLFAIVLIALFKSAPANVANGPAPATGPKSSAPAGATTAWGTFEDPLGDSRLTTTGNIATIEVPGVYHDFVAPPGKADAPRILQLINAGDFVVQVRVAGEDRPTDPPARGAPIPFHGAGLVLWNSHDDFIRLERASFVRAGQVQTYILFEHLRANRPHVEQDGWYHGGAVHLRLERRGSQVIGSFSTDGVQWQSLAPEEFNSAGAKVGVAAVNTTAAPYSVQFEDFTVKKP